jgi:hypothetical protein
MSKFTESVRKPDVPDEYQANVIISRLIAANRRETKYTQEVSAEGLKSLKDILKPQLTSQKTETGILQNS